MALINITTTDEEQQAVLDTLKTLNGESVSVAKIASMCGLSTSRARYAIADLVEANKIQKVPTKLINPHYKRYTYEIVQK